MSGASLRHRFETDGYVVVRGVFTSSEAAQLAGAVGAVFAADASPEIAGRSLRRTSLVRSAQLWRRSAAVRRFVFCERITELARTLLDASQVRLIGDDALLKPVRSRITSWHHDGEFVPIPPGTMLTMWLPLEAVEARSGTLAYAAGSHRLALPRPPGALRGETLSHWWYALQLWCRRVRTETIDAQPGDVLVHHGGTLHKGHANTTDRPRLAFGLHFADARARLFAPRTPSQHEHVRTAQWGSLRPGDEISAASTPIVG